MGEDSMSEPKTFASLSPSLLARKGSAKPAMRPQSFRFNSDSANLAAANEPLDDLGWNDMGDDTPVPAPAVPIALHKTPIATLVVPPRVVAQQEELAQHFEASAPEPAAVVPAVAPVIVQPVVTQPVAAPVVVAPTAPTVRAVPGAKAKAAFTLRLDPERHLRLRLVCAVNHRSAQQIVTQALDEYLANQPENSRLATFG
jgi:hypothetical protein